MFDHTVTCFFSYKLDRRKFANHQKGSLETLDLYTRRLKPFQPTPNLTFNMQTTSTLTLLHLGLLSAVHGACIGPDVNAATVQLIESFEGWRSDVCKSLSFSFSFLADHMKTPIQPAIQL